MKTERPNPESAEQTIRVEIYNQTYSIRSDGDNDYIRRLAEYVDGKCARYRPVRLPSIR